MSNTREVKKAVMPVAGLGTRMWTATKVVPKPLLTVHNKPAVQLVVEEARAAGIEQILFVDSPHNHGLIQAHFDPALALEDTLRSRGKRELLAAMQAVRRLVSPLTIHQSEARGLGDAVLQARDWVGDEPFAVLLADDLISPQTPCLPRMLQIKAEHPGKNVLCLFEVGPDKVSTFGIVTGEPVPGEPDVMKVTSGEEKPKAENAPRLLFQDRYWAVAGRYVCEPGIFVDLDNTRPGTGGEIQITDALLSSAQRGGCYGLLFQGDRFDTGTPSGLNGASDAYEIMEDPEQALARFQGSFDYLLRQDPERAIRLFDHMLASLGRDL